MILVLKRQDIIQQQLNLLKSNWVMDPYFETEVSNSDLSWIPRLLEEHEFKWNIKAYRFWNSRCNNLEQHQKLIFSSSSWRVNIQRILKVAQMKKKLFNDPFVYFWSKSTQKIMIEKTVSLWRCELWSAYSLRSGIMDAKLNWAVVENNRHYQNNLKKQ
jgi:hypothetical protein